MSKEPKNLILNILNKELEILGIGKHFLPFHKSFISDLKQLIKVNGLNSGNFWNIPMRIFKSSFELLLTL